MEELQNRPAEEVVTAEPDSRAPGVESGNIDALNSGLGSSGVPILVCFCADWSSDCHEARVLLDSLSKRYGKGLRVRLIDPSSEVALAKNFRITSLPTFIVFDRLGNLVLRREELMQEDDVRDVLVRLGLDAP